MSANYWEQIPALTPLQFYKPYQPAYEEKLKTIQAQTAYWQEGARQVNSVLDKANQLSLVTENKNRAQKFEQEADDKIVDLVKMNNLAVNGVAAQALNVYAPLFNDVDINQEDSLLKNNSNVLAKNEAEKTKDGGKYYNTALETKVNADIALLKKYGKKDAWKLAKPVEYSPYYDKAKEQNEFLKNNVGDISVRDEIIRGGGLDGAFVQTTKNADVDYMRLYQQWQSKKSDKYKAQERLESDAEFATGILTLNPDELANKYAAKATTAFETNRRYIDQEIAQGEIRMSNLEKQEDKDALKGKIEANKISLKTLTENYQTNLGYANEIKGVNDKIFKLNDLSAIQRVNSLANFIDDQYNNTQFAVNNSYENNSITYKSAPANFQNTQQGLITALQKEADAKAKLEEDTTKAAKKAIEDGKAPQEYQMIFNDGYNADGTLTLDAIRYNQAVNAQVRSLSSVALGTENDGTTKDNVMTEARRNIITIDQLKTRINNTVSSALFAENKGIVKTLTQGASADNLEEQDLEEIRNKAASIHYLEYKKLNPNGTNTLDTFKGFYKNSTPQNLVNSYNNRISDILKPDEFGHVDSKSTEILAQGLTPEKQKQLTESLLGQEVYYKGNTIKNLQITTDAIYNSDRTLYNSLKSRGRLTEDGRLKSDITDQELKEIYPQKDYTAYQKLQNGLNFGNANPNNAAARKKIDEEANVDITKVLNAIKEGYYQNQMKQVENVSEVTLRLEDVNDNNGKGTTDDLNKKDFAIQRSIVGKMIQNTGSAVFMTEDGKLKPLSSLDGNKSQLGDMFKQAVQEGTVNIDAVTITQDVIDQDGPNKTNLKALTVKFNIDNILGKQSGFRDQLEAKGIIEKVDKDYQFKEEYKNLSTSDGLQFKIDEITARKAGFSDDFLEKRSAASAAVVQTGKGAGLPITVYDKDGKSYDFRIKNISGDEKDPQFRIIDLTGSLKLLGEQFTPDYIMQGMELDLRNAGFKDYTSKTIGDNLSQRFINLWYANINRSAPTTQTK